MTGSYIDNFLNHQLRRLRIAVMGDVMLERYVFGTVERISPEAPVPVNKVTRTRAVPGGAANVAANLSGLECRVYLAGLIGDDENGRAFRTLVQKAHIDDRGLWQRPHHAMTTKMRILGDRQQMIRLDFERTVTITAAEEAFFLQWLQQRIADGLDGLILSDYAKGVLSPRLTQSLIKMAKAAHIVVLADPKGTNWEKYNGADFVTPNVKETGICLGTAVANTQEAVYRAAKAIHERYEFAHLLITRSEKGLTVVRRDGKCWYSPATAQEVFDVSGAGDTAAASFMAAIGAKLSIRAGLQLANTAAGIVVSKVGTHPVGREDLLQLWRQRQGRRWHTYHTRSWQAVAKKIRQWQAVGETVVFTNGCFDLLHRGHIRYLQQAAGQGDHLVVGLNADSSVRRLKGDRRPLVSEEDRAILLHALSCVEEVVIFSEDTPEQLLAVLRPDILVKGGDYTPEEVAGRSYVKEVKIMPFCEGYSTSALVAKICTVYGVKTGE